MSKTKSERTLMCTAIRKAIEVADALEDTLVSALLAQALEAAQCGEATPEAG